jgi:hypothetical protein
MCVFLTLIKNGQWMLRPSRVNQEIALGMAGLYEVR